ncbi:hypothetical protein BH11BAC7_BH11BAC7_02430 [soil metagenome]
MKTALSIKIFLLSLATLVLFNGFGLYVYAYTRIGIHRLDQKENINTLDLQRLVLNGEEFSTIAWIGPADFIYKNHVYDCEQIASLNGKITLMCYADEEETTIKNTVADSFEKHDSKNTSSNKAHKDLLKIFPLILFSEKSAVVFNSRSTAIFLSAPASSTFISPAPEITSPPPEVA